MHIHLDLKSQDYQTSVGQFGCPLQPTMSSALNGAEHQTELENQMIEPFVMDGLWEWDGTIL